MLLNCKDAFNHIYINMVVHGLCLAWFCSPQNPKSGCFCRGFCAGSFPVLSKCCPTTLHSLLHGFARSSVFLEQLQGLPQHRGFCSNAFSIHLYMCSPIGLHLLMMLCPAKNMIYIIHVWLSYLGKL